MESNTTISPVHIIKSISVCPKNDLSEPNKIVTLSNLDRQCPSLMYMVFFYKSSGNDSFDDVFDRLRAGLEETLSVWYPAAGRLRLSSPNHLDIWCNNGGAVFVQAETGAKISDFGDLSFYNEFFQNLVFKPNNEYDNITEMPLVTAQVTKFDCGGYSVGTGTSHALFDGISAYEFLNAWASNCHQDNSESLYKPVHERCTLLLENNSSITTMPTAIDHLYQLITQANPSSQVIQQSHVFNTFHLSSSMIEKLKKNAFDDEENDNASCSSFELLAAHTWKVRTKALGLETGRKVCLQFAVDTRKRMVPPLPNGFSGNAYVLVSVLLTAEELEKKSYKCIIKLIKDAKNSATHDYVNAYINALEGPHAALPPLPELTVVSDWTRVPFHAINFFGEKATYASPLIPPVPQVTYFMRNPNEIGGVDVRIALPPNIETVFSCHFINML